MLLWAYIKAFVDLTETSLHLVAAKLCRRWPDAEQTRTWAGQLLQRILSQPLIPWNKGNNLKQRYTKIADLSEMHKMNKIENDKGNDPFALVAPVVGNFKSFNLRLGI